MSLQDLPKNMSANLVVARQSTGLGSCSLEVEELDVPANFREDVRSGYDSRARERRGPGAR